MWAEGCLDDVGTGAAAGTKASTGTEMLLRLGPETKGPMWAWEVGTGTLKRGALSAGMNSSKVRVL